MAKPHQYWLVGATWENEDLTNKFIRNKYWKMGYSDESKPDLAQLREQMKAGDRIAIKSRCGQGSDQVRIKALGIIIGREKTENGKVFVDWKVTGLDKLVPAHGWFATIHGPYDADNPWILEAFVL